MLLPGQNLSVAIVRLTLKLGRVISGTVEPLVKGRRSGGSLLARSSEPEDVVDAEV